MWNYRIIKDKDTYGLYEVIYNDDGKICAHSEKPEIISEKPQELVDTLELMLKDAKRSKFDILEYNKIKFSEFCKDTDKGEEITLEELDKILKDLE